ncbi:hypothetical protein L208DRAFT_1381582 [Tricholoma matsutake]|nr:hypothetical protein L208DRAFT_1381582 [Tricholoma matsutake 945]
MYARQGKNAQPANPNTSPAMKVVFATYPVVELVVELLVYDRYYRPARLGEGFRTPECVQVRWRVGHVTRVEEKRKAGFMYIIIAGHNLSTMLEHLLNGLHMARAVPPSQAVFHQCDLKAKIASVRSDVALNAAYQVFVMTTFSAIGFDSESAIKDATSSGYPVPVLPCSDGVRLGPDAGLVTLYTFSCFTKRVRIGVFGTNPEDGVSRGMKYGPQGNPLREESLPILHNTIIDSDWRASSCLCDSCVERPVPPESQEQVPPAA